jgi:hypothetical protein
MYTLVLLQQEVVVWSCCHIKPRHNQTIYFFDNAINTNGYLAMLPNNSTLQLCYLNTKARTMVCAWCSHVTQSNVVLDFLHETFGDRVMSRCIPHRHAYGRTRRFQCGLSCGNPWSRNCSWRNSAHNSNLEHKFPNCVVQFPQNYVANAQVVFETARCSHWMQCAFETILQNSVLHRTCNM